MQTLGLVLAYGMIHAAAHWWQKNTPSGQRFRHFCENWRTDWVHGLFVSVTVFIWACVSILLLGTVLHALHI